MHPYQIIMEHQSITQTVEFYIGKLSTNTSKKTCNNEHFAANEKKDCLQG